MARDYFPEGIPLEVDPALAGWAYDQFQRISEALTTRDVARLEINHSPPTKPRDVEIRFADGTDWDPGMGRGLYVYYDATWHKIA